MSRGTRRDVKGSPASSEALPAAIAGRAKDGAAAGLGQEGLVSRESPRLWGVPGGELDTAQIVPVDAVLASRKRPVSSRLGSGWCMLAQA
jgi:hypothetical protein